MCSRIHMNIIFLSYPALPISTLCEMEVIVMWLSKPVIVLSSLVMSITIPICYIQNTGNTRWIREGSVFQKLGCSLENEINSLFLPLLNQKLHDCDPWKNHSKSNVCQVKYQPTLSNRNLKQKARHLTFEIKKNVLNQGNIRK